MPSVDDPRQSACPGRTPACHHPARRIRHPHIEADEEWDAWYGLGFCQGQDRAFKLESLMRVARGTLAERVGPSALPLDRLSRRIGFSHSAERQVELLAPDIRQMLEAFARGVNDGIKLGSRRKAHEFAILRASPTPFTAVDSIAISKLSCFGMASNWDVEMARLKIARDDGKDALLSLDPTYPEWPSVSHAHDDHRPREARPARADGQPHRHRVNEDGPRRRRLGREQVLDAGRAVGESFLTALRRSATIVEKGRWGAYRLVGGPNTRSCGGDAQTVARTAIRVAPYSN